MNGAEQVTEVARGISDYGMTVVVGAVYIVLTAAMMVAVFKWFKSMIERTMNENSEVMREILTAQMEQTRMMTTIYEQAKTETMLRIRNLTGFAFDLAIEQVCRIIKKVRTENHIANHEATKRKIRLLLHNIHEDRNSRFDAFSFHGKTISEYTSNDWIDRVAAVIEKELYEEDAPDNGRAYTNVKAVYDNIKIDFYHRLQQ